MRVTADITLSDPPWTQEQIATEIKHQNEVMRSADRLLKGSQRAEQFIASSNAIAQSHSGVRVLHVQEWYSGNHYRLDQTDEAMVTAKYLRANPNKYRDTYVNIDDPAFSTYRSFFVDHELHDAQLSKVTIYHRNDLWQAMGLDQQLSLPLILALVDIHSVNPSHNADLSTIKVDVAKADRIHKGLDPQWRLDATDDVLGGTPTTRFVLRRRNPMPEGAPVPLAVEATYWIGNVAGNVVCLQGLLTNQADHSSFISEHEQFDAGGFPHVWKTLTSEPGSPPKQFDVVFKEIDLSGAFTDEQVFAPAFPSNYIVADVTLGAAVVLQNPRPEVRSVVSPTGARPGSKRVIVLVVLAFVAVVPALVAYLTKRQRRVV
jgi:hypothetical protein